MFLPLTVVAVCGIVRGYALAWHKLALQRDQPLLLLLLLYEYHRCRSSPFALLFGHIIFPYFFYVRDRTFKNLGTELTDFRLGIF